MYFLSHPAHPMYDFRKDSRSPKTIAVISTCRRIYSAVTQKWDDSVERYKTVHSRYTEALIDKLREGASMKEALESLILAYEDFEDSTTETAAGENGTDTGSPGSGTFAAERFDQVIALLAQCGPDNLIQPN